MMTGDFAGYTPKYRPMVKGQEYLVSTITGPSGLPRLAASIEQMSRPGGILEELEIQIGLQALQSDTVGYGPDELKQVVADTLEQGKKMGRWYGRRIKESELWWCSEDMTDVVCDVASTMPGDVVLTRELVPHQSGFVVFDRSIAAHGAVQGESMNIDGVQWGPTNLAPNEEFPDGTACISLIAFARIGRGYEYPDGGISDVPVGYELWAPMGRSDWPWGYRLEQPPNYGFNWSIPRIDSMVEDRAIMAALWTVAKTHTVAHVTKERPNRPERRRLQRANATHAETHVNVIHLRREIVKSHHPDGITDEEATRKHSHRWIVRAHVRNQAYGPGRKQHRPVLIAPHVKGPEGAPMLKSKRVWSLDR